MSRLDGPRDYCGRLPDWSSTASCLKLPGHGGPHRSMQNGKPRDWDEPPRSQTTRGRIAEAIRRAEDDFRVGKTRAQEGDYLPEIYADGVIAEFPELFRDGD